MARTDLKQIDNDIVFENGDLKVSISDEQHVQDTINAFKGWWREYPSDGVGIQQFLGSSFFEEIVKREITIELEKDGYASSPLITQNYKGTTDIDPRAEINY